ncbi:carboxymuconolactone decarboxylase family protein [Xenorhabdus nematophila]|uniref:carboxymuconolactone decarboxylase family protein n=1 Tax=Xenorhabdus nematophila TaxID=628 RepID=UPI00054428AF|nr:carboxymuconolactone decarboxylase family protein [Xenorhabdus nematophila]CEF31231.1 Carboxymuconolactone decarboxylase family protein [Xenorhabdus nematophila str. Websteri]AYA41088.1 carboxymuconolactone decarboxylase [Xenorhabdus nematophila]KHD27287.1 carboxymuconolactone decarboxylase [Xenorhabdus nematophila]MBA0019837.1 carboxymuconolactone decarboxylase family protein [Xenorhabdus nematophila]MCB4426641.1 carboxymuconolactone decarboxylase [Xenorhabdus nematophila]
MKSSKTLTEHGRYIMELLEPGLADKIMENLSELDSDLPFLITDYAFGAILGREGLNLKAREMISVASLITLGNAQPQLELHMRAALNVGVTEKELLEIIIQMAVYAGIPACMNGLTAFRAAVAQKNTLNTKTGEKL